MWHLDIIYIITKDLLFSLLFAIVFEHGKIALAALDGMLKLVGTLAAKDQISLWLLAILHRRLVVQLVIGLILD